jgi:hypothetical protein
MTTAFKKDVTGVASHALFGNEMFTPELLKRATAPAWKDCPTGTIAYSHTGTNWTKQDDGRWRANGGDAFPTPGADACLVRLPNSVLSDS